MRVRILLLCLSLLTMFACVDPENIDATPTQLALPVQDLATATRIIPTPTLRPSTTPTTTAAATITATPTITITITSIPEAVTRVELTVGAANLRLGAGTEFAVIGVISAGEDIALLDTSLDTTWYKVRTVDGLEGWVGSTVARIVEGGN